MDIQPAYVPFYKRPVFWFFLAGISVIFNPLASVLVEMFPSSTLWIYGAFLLPFTFVVVGCMVGSAIAGHWDSKVAAILITGINLFIGGRLFIAGGASIVISDASPGVASLIPLLISLCVLVIGIYGCVRAWTAVRQGQTWSRVLKVASISTLVLVVAYEGLIYWVLRNQ